MKEFRLRGPLSCLVIGLQSFLLGPNSTAQDPHEYPLPLDAKAIFRTHVPHLKSNPRSETGPGATPAMEAASSAFLGPAYSVGPIVTVTTTAPAAEEHIAVDPNNPSTLVAAISDFGIRGGYNTTKYAFSTDNGASWLESYLEYDLETEFLMTGDGFFWLANSDPVVAIDRAGNVYLLNVYIGILNDNGIYVSWANPSGGAAQFTAQETSPIATNPDLLSEVFEDKPWLTVDNGASVHGGNLYASWSRFVGNTVDTIVFSRSTDRGLTWSSAIPISPPAQDGAVQGSQVAVGPNGEVYVAYELFYVGGKRQHLLAQSLDGGQTFSAPVAVTPLFNELSFNSTYRKNSFSSLAVSPSTGTVCLAYADQPNGSVGAQVKFVRWTPGVDAGFSAPQVLNDRSAGHQFFPALTVELGGAIHASWFDTRNSAKRSSRYDIYATRSLDGGVTFGANARVTPSLVNAGSASFIGDYAGIAAAGGAAHPVWTSGGFNGGRLQTAKLE